MRNTPALALAVWLSVILSTVFPGQGSAQGPAVPPLPQGAASPTAAQPIPSATSQLLVAVADTWDSTTGTLALYERPASDKAWKIAVRPFVVAFGRSGLAWGRGLHKQDGLTGPMKREGDGKAPAGVFALGPAFAYEPKELGAMKLPVLHASDALICVDETASPLYNTIVDAGSLNAPSGQAGAGGAGAMVRPAAAEPTSQPQPALPGHERMRRKDEQYRFGLVVRHNMEPPVPGGGSCIFLHIWHSPLSPTSGCTAMDKANLKALLTRLDPAKQPLLVQLTKDEYTRLRKDWGLP